MDEDLVANPYRKALVAAEDESWLARERLKTALREVTELWMLAWQGGCSHEQLQILWDIKTDAERAVQHAQDEFDYALSGQTEQVDRNSWQAKWRNL